jgi:glutamine transport system permease protein
LYQGYHKIREWNAPPRAYTIGIDTTWHPLHLHGAEHNMSAFASELIFNIAQDQGIKIGLIRSGHKCVYDMLDDGKVDGVLAPVPKNTNQDYYYSEPVYRYGAVIIVKKGSDIKSLSDLEKRRVAVKRGSPILYRLALDPKVIVLLYDNPIIALENVSKGEYDAVVMDQLLTFLYYGGTYKEGLRTAGPPLTTEALRLVTLKRANQEELVEKFNAGLKHLKEEGTYRQMLEDWGLYDPEAAE